MILVRMEGFTRRVCDDEDEGSLPQGKAKSRD